MFNTIGFKLSQMARHNQRRLAYRTKPHQHTRRFINLSVRALRGLK